MNILGLLRHSRTHRERVRPRAERGVLDYRELLTAAERVIYCDPKTPSAWPPRDIIDWINTANSSPIVPRK